MRFSGNAIWVGVELGKKGGGEIELGRPPKSYDLGWILQSTN